jgi:AcrR family transcriptional regulator
MGGLPRAYRSAARTAQVEARQLRIVEAAYHLLKSTRPVDLSYVDVATRAGVSLRTVYRHFPTADDLFAAVSRWLFASPQAWSRPPPETAADLVGDVEEWFGRLERDPALYRVIFAVPSRSLFDLPGTLTHIFRAELARLPEDDRRAALALIELQSCPYAWDVMHHNYKLPLERSLRAATVGIQAIIDYLARDPAALSPASPPPKLARRKEKP